MSGSNHELMNVRALRLNVAGDLPTRMNLDARGASEPTKGPVDARSGQGRVDSVSILMVGYPRKG